MEVLGKDDRIKIYFIRIMGVITAIVLSSPAWLKPEWAATISKIIN